MVKCTLKWLKRHIDFKDNINPSNVLEFIKKLSFSLNKRGIEVEQITLINPFIIVKIEEVIRKQGLKVAICSTTINEEIKNLINYENNVIQVLCGDSSVEAGINTVMAPIGTKVGDFEIKERSILGEISKGMFCSKLELGETDKDSLCGVIRLNKEDNKIYKFEDIFFKLSVATNRWDLMNVRGIARELAFDGFGVLKSLDLGAGNKPMNIKIKSDVNTPISFITINDIKVSSEIIYLMNNIDEAQKTDLKYLNDFVIIDIGHPIHIYDNNDSVKEIDIRYLSEGESFVTIKNENFISKGVEILILTNNEPACIGGIIGIKGFNNETKNVIIEAGYFKPENISDLISTSAKLFDLGIDNKRAVLSYIAELVTGDKSEIYITTGETEHIKNINLSINDFYNISNLEIPIEKMQLLLESYGFQTSLVRRKQDININDQFILQVKRPSWRSDIKIQEDVIEEILRINGIDDILNDTVIFNFNKKLIYKDTKTIVADQLCVLGFTEMYNFPFTATGDIKIINSLNINKSYMRNSLLENLTQNCLETLSHGSANCLLFEIGKIYPSEEQKLGLIVTGEEQRSWENKTEKYDLVYLKKILFSLSKYINFDLKFQTSIEKNGLINCLGFDNGFIGQVDSSNKLLKNVYYAEFVKRNKVQKKNCITQSLHYKDISIKIAKQYNFKNISDILDTHNVNYNEYYIFDYFIGEEYNHYGITLKMSDLNILEERIQLIAQDFKKLIF